MRQKRSALAAYILSQGWESNSPHVARSAGSKAKVRPKKSMKAAASGAFRWRMRFSKGAVPSIAIFNVPV